MSCIEFRSIRPGEREAVLDLLREWYGDRDFFARYFYHDPAFRDDLCFVACDGPRIVSTFQVFRKRVRASCGEIEVAGVGNVFTTPTDRRRGLAFKLLRFGLEQLAAQPFEVSLLFASRLEFYGALGYRSHPRLLTLITGTAAADDTPPTYEVRPAARDDLPAVRALYDAYTQALYGCTIRDVAYWQGQLRYAGNPDESFLVACQHGQVLAYARATQLFDLNVVMEHAFAPGHTQALVQLALAHHERRASHLPGTLAHLEHEPEIRAALQVRGLTLNRVEDLFCMWRVLDPRRLASKMGTSLASTEQDSLWAELFPPERSVYWISDRF